jgi:hypothetical protein
MRAKFKRENTYTATCKAHNGKPAHTIRVTGRTKREAVMRAKKQFTRAGIVTRPNVEVDLLVLTLVHT